jgi:CheY-like chemotaxis protein
MHVLIAADDAPLSKLLLSLLREDGYTPRAVPDGHQTLEVLRTSSQPLVAMLSLRWPPLHSRAVLERVAADLDLRARHAYVLLTANWDALPTDYRALLTSLAVAIVPKPFELDDVLTAVAQAAGRCGLP